MTIGTKMHSLGRDLGEADAYYALTKEEIELLAVTEHNRWSVERLLTGTRPCTDEEKEQIRKSIRAILDFRKTGGEKSEGMPVDLKKKMREICHFDLCAYEELEQDATGKNAQTYDYALTACIPLLVKTYYEYSEHE